MIPISEAIKYPVGTRFRFEEIDPDDAFSEDGFEGQETELVLDNKFIAPNTGIPVYFNTYLPNTTFTLINE
jgi:hypothetical protein